MGVILTTYEAWDAPPSRSHKPPSLHSMFLRKLTQETSNDLAPQNWLFRKNARAFTDVRNFLGGNISDVAAPRHVPNPGKLFFFKSMRITKLGRLVPEIISEYCNSGCKNQNTVLKYTVYPKNPGMS